MQCCVILILLIYCTEKYGVRLTLKQFSLKLLVNFVQIITIKKASNAEFKLEIFRKTEIKYPNNLFYLQVLKIITII